MWPPGPGYAFINNRYVMQLQVQPEEEEPTFPIEGTFNSRFAVKHYMSGDYIQCLLCGKKLKRLEGHIRSVHRITIDSYKRKYNIPLSFKLECEELYNKMKSKKEPA